MVKNIVGNLTPASRGEIYIFLARLIFFNVNISSTSYNVEWKC